MKSVLKYDLIEHMALKSNLDKDQANQVFQAMMATFQSSFKAEKDVKIPGFGTFHVRKKNARPGRNPRTGEPVTIREKKTVLLRASSFLKKRLMPSS
jgi:nucleoid DNA-binding protein